MTKKVEEWRLLSATLETHEGDGPGVWQPSLRVVIGMADGKTADVYLTFAHKQQVESLVGWLKTIAERLPEKMG